VGHNLLAFVVGRHRPETKDSERPRESKEGRGETWAEDRRKERKKGGRIFALADAVEKVFSVSFLFSRPFFLCDVHVGHSLTMNTAPSASFPNLQATTVSFLTGLPVEISRKWVTI